MIEQSESNNGQNSLDEATVRDIMSYYRIDNHDELVRYIGHLGIGHED